MLTSSQPFDISLEDVFDLLLRHLIHSLTSLVRFEPRQCAPNAIPKGYDRFEARHETFDLAIIEDCTPHLVAQQSPCQLRFQARNKVGWDMHDLRFHTQPLGYGLIYLVPRQ